MAISMSDKRAARRQDACDHASSTSFSVAGLRRDLCGRCGRISIAYVRPARTGVLFSIPREADADPSGEVVWKKGA